MPKGHKIVDWTDPQNTRKLLLAIIEVDSTDSHEVAAAFGYGVTSRCIYQKLRKLRSEVKHGVKTTKSANGKTYGKQKGSKSDFASMNESDSSDGEQTATPSKTSNINANAHKIISGRVAQTVSSRKPAIKKHKKPENLLADLKMVNEDQDKGISAAQESSENKGSSFSDEKVDQEQTTIKTEEKNVMIL